MLTKLVDCRPGRQLTSGQLDYLSGKDDYDVQCKGCHIKLPMFRRADELDICTTCNAQLILLDEDAYPVVPS